jgi:hypothetical protein
LRRDASWLFKKTSVPGQVGESASIVPAKAPSDAESESADDAEYSSDDDDGEEKAKTANEKSPPVNPLSGNTLRFAAGKALSGISAAATIFNRREPRKRRPVVTEEDLEEEEPEFEIAEVEMMLKSEERDGELYYLVKWLGSDENGESQYSCVTKEEAAGVPEWIAIVDDWMKYQAYCAEKKLKPKPYSAFINSHQKFLTLGSNSEVTCVYVAVNQASKLLEIDFQWTSELIKEFESRAGVEGAARQGLTKGEVGECLDFATTRGWTCRVEKNMLGSDGLGKAGLAGLITETGGQVW